MRLGEGGAALVIALLVLLVISVFGAALIVTTTTETKISSHQLRDSQALGVAEAGVEEVISRMSLHPADRDYIGDASFPLRLDWRTTVLLTDSPPPDSLPHYYVKSIQMGSTGDKLRYSTDDRDDPDNLVVYHKTQGDLIYFCNLSDRSLYLESPDHIGFPVEVIEVTGRKGNAERRIIAEVVKVVDPRYVPTGGAFWWWGGLTGSDGSMKICGHNHYGNLDLSTGLYDTPDCDPFHIEPCQFPYRGMGDSMWTWGIQDPENCDPPGCAVGVNSVPHVHWWTPQWDNIEYVELYGNPAVKYPHPPFPRLWEILGYPDEATMRNELPWHTVSSGDTLKGPCMVEDLKLRIDKHTPLGKGHGILWVRGDKKPGSQDNYYGDLDIGKTDDPEQFGFTYTGLLYVEGSLKAHRHSTFRTLGTVLVRTGDLAPADPNPNSSSGAIGPIDGDIISCYSSDAIAKEVVGISGHYQFLSWREK